MCIVKDLSFAKEIFVEYSGDHYEMMRDNIGDLYGSFEVSKEQELRWAKEQEVILLKTFENGNILHGREKHLLVSYLCRYIDFSIQEKFLDILSKQVNTMCTFSKLLFAQDLFRIHACNKQNWNSFTFSAQDILVHTKDMAIALLNLAFTNPITVDVWYTNRIGFNGSDFTDQRLKERILGLAEDNDIVLGGNP